MIYKDCSTQIDIMRRQRCLPWGFSCFECVLPVSPETPGLDPQMKCLIKLGLIATVATATDGTPNTVVAPPIDSGKSNADF